MAGTLHVVARLAAKADKIEQLRTVLLALIEPSRAEPGCIRYEMFQNIDDPTDFTFTEEWKDLAALDSHMATPHFQAAVAKLGDLLAGDADIRKYTLVA